MPAAVCEPCCDLRLTARSMACMRPGLRAQAAVVGTSCRLDVLELLEKRVASRMSCRKELVLEPCAAADACSSPSALLQVPPELYACTAGACCASLAVSTCCAVPQASLSAAAASNWDGTSRSIAGTCLNAASPQLVTALPVRLLTSCAHRQCCSCQLG